MNRLWINVDAGVGGKTCLLRVSEIMKACRGMHKRIMYKEQAYFDTKRTIEGARRASDTTAESEDNSRPK